MTLAEIDALNRDYEFVGFERHFVSDNSLVRFLLRIDCLEIVAWWWLLEIYDMPEMIFRRRITAE